jgi:hypothetical protein
VRVRVPPPAQYFGPCRSQSEGTAQKIIDTHPARPREQQPEIRNCVKRLVELNEIVDAGHLLLIYLKYCDQHVDDHRYRNEARTEAEYTKPPADELCIRGKRCVEVWIGNTPALCKFGSILNQFSI